MAWKITSSPARMLIAGILVVGLSIGCSLAATHASFQTDGGVSYEHAMLIAFCIPAAVAPPSFIYFIWTARRMERLNQQLNLLARQDSLTKLDNRRAFVEQATAQLESGTVQMLVMVDIDHFKHINDSLGHSGGDLALQHAAAIIAAAAPGDALVARIGGEEFGLLLPLQQGGDACSDGEAVVEVIRQRLEALPLITPAGLTRMTASFGIAVSRLGESLDHLFARADRALYDAKNAGRNQLAVAS
ncbi:GGDEF domain-containing protein [Novosphingobium sp. AAP93]|uniref:GGDEF domain-containing protein n=1 Tax=Novosphingobium sp. AAP93 TaxID=1523427 RepID=UPI0012E139F6|nr:GGDEF domain-containing protein [Novosphingobium sp. AAP93]